MVESETATVDWEWTREELDPEDILDAARTIEVNSSQITVDTTSHWVNTRRYLDWASVAISRGGEDAWDSAAGWAKRAVCQRMDAILVHNHFGSFLGQNYKRKADYLTELNVPGSSLLRDLVIDPRNVIEHSYVLATEAHARRAYEVAQLFVDATEAEANIPAIAALGWNISHRHEACDIPGQKYDKHEFRLSHWQEPMLLIDSYSPDAEVFIINPKETVLGVCARDSFKSSQLTELNSMLRKCLDFTSYSSYRFDRSLMKTLRDQLGFEFNSTKA